MLFFDATLQTPADNLALDEALLDWAELKSDQEPLQAEVFRLWEPAEPFVVLGRTSRLHEEVDVEACQKYGVPILRRSSGGATILAGPGCLMYAVVLSYEKRPHLRSIPEAHCFVLHKQQTALQTLVPSVTIAGTSDLVYDSNAGSSWTEAPNLSCPKENANEKQALRKFSGNSLRCKRTHLLYHGTVMYNFDLQLISQLLRRAPREPDYRNNRDHSQFIANLPATKTSIQFALQTAWPTDKLMVDWPKEQTEALVQRRYGQRDWTECFL